MYDGSRRNFGIAPSSYTNLNRLLVHIISSLTSSLRLDGTLNFDVTKFQTNVVPRPRVMSNCLWPRSSCLSLKLALAMTHATCCLMHRGDVVPKGVSAASATLMTKCIFQVVDWSPTGMPAPHRECQQRRAQIKRAVCSIRNLLFDLVVFGRHVVDITATSVEFESPLVDVSEALHRPSGCLATSNVGSSAELLGAWG